MARPGLDKHPKFRRLCFMLQEPAPHVYGYLEFMWQVAYEAGNPLLGDATDVELAAQFPGEPGKFTKAALGCGGDRPGFLELNTDGKYEIHDLFANAPDYVQKRLKREFDRNLKGQTISDLRKAAANKRWKDANKQQIDANGCKRLPLADSQYAKVRTPAPAPAPFIAQAIEEIPQTTPCAQQEPPAFVDPNFDQRIDPLWKRFQDGFAQIKPNAPVPSLTAGRRWKVAEILRDHSPDDVLKAFKWFFTSRNERAVSAREKGSVETVLNPDNFQKYFELAGDPDAWKNGKVNDNDNLDSLRKESADVRQRLRDHEAK